MSMREQIAKALLRGKVGGPTPSGIQVYHSSPHDFDKFDLSKLRSGEGANIRGEGFYFAESPAVSGQGGQYWNSFQDRFTGGEGRASEFLRQADFDRQKALDIAKFNAKNQTHPRVVQEYEQAMELLRSGGKPIGPRTYEVNIKAAPEQLLDLDKGVGGQSAYVTERLKALGIEPQVVSLENTQRLAHDLLNDLRKVKGAAPWVGEDIEEIAKRVGNFTKPQHIWAEMRDIPSYYGIPTPGAAPKGFDPIPSMWDEIAPTVHSKLGNIRASIAETPTQMHLEDALQGPQRTADALRSVDIPGSRYFDAGSRTPGMNDAPTFNYVINTPSKLDILAKYGVGGALPLGALADQAGYGGDDGVR